MRPKQAVLLIRKRQQNYIVHCLSVRVGTCAGMQRGWLDRPCRSFNDYVFLRQNFTDVRRNIRGEGTEKVSAARSPPGTVQLPRHLISTRRPTKNVGTHT